MESRKMLLMGSSGKADIESRLVDTAWEGTGGTN